jgi:hypothetical protein
MNTRSLCPSQFSNFTTLLCLPNYFLIFVPQLLNEDGTDVTFDNSPEQKSHFLAELAWQMNNLAN